MFGFKTFYGKIRFFGYLYFVQLETDTTSLCTWEQEQPTILLNCSDGKGLEGREESVNFKGYIPIVNGIRSESPRPSGLFLTFKREDLE